MSEDDIFRTNDFQGWVQHNKARQKELVEAIEQRERIKSSWSNRRSAESQKRLHLLNVAADTKTDESEFDDWDVYITMVKFSFLSLLYIIYSFRIYFSKLIK